ncbi:hypothetical protein ACFE04_013475 [Oxalis oulophora]
MSPGVATELCQSPRTPTPQHLSPAPNLTPFTAFYNISQNQNAAATGFSSLTFGSQPGPQVVVLAKARLAKIKKSQKSRTSRDASKERDHIDPSFNPFVLGLGQVNGNGSSDNVSASDANNNTGAMERGNDAMDCGDYNVDFNDQALNNSDNCYDSDRKNMVFGNTYAKSDEESTCDVQFGFDSGTENEKQFTFSASVSEQGSVSSTKRQRKKYKKKVGNDLSVIIPSSNVDVDTCSLQFPSRAGSETSSLSDRGNESESDEQLKPSSDATFKETCDTWRLRMPDVKSPCKSRISPVCGSSDLGNHMIILPYTVDAVSS